MIHKRSKDLRNKVSLRQQVSRCYFHEWEAVLTMFGLGRKELSFSLWRTKDFSYQALLRVLHSCSPFSDSSLSLSPLVERAVEFRLWVAVKCICPWPRGESHRKVGAHLIRISPNSGQFRSQCEWPWASTPSASSFCDFPCPLTVLGLELCLRTGSSGFWSSGGGWGPSEQGPKESRWVPRRGRACGRMAGGGARVPIVPHFSSGSALIP